LHTIVTAAKQNRTEKIDQYMESRVESFNLCTVSFHQKAFIFPMGDGAPYGDDEIDREDYRSPCCEMKDTKSPSREASPVALDES
jgi:hypothetical protein